MTESSTDFDKIRLDLIKDAYARGMRYGQITPDMQINQWLKIGLMRMEENKGTELTKEDLKEIDGEGGTDHPDPTLRSMGKLHD